MFTALDVFLLIFFFLIMAGVLVGAFIAGYNSHTKVIILIVEICLLVAMVGGCAAYHTKTESGKRSLKTWQSETTGGIDRTVTVYDINGEEIAKYTGRFDVEESSQEGVVKIKFDCDGKRHIIYAQTGTVLIDEN